MKRSGYLTRKTPLRGKARPRPLAVEALPQIVPALSVPPPVVVVSSGPRAVGEPLSKRVEIISERYLDGVRALSCAFCPSLGTPNAHHVERRGMEQRRNDLSAVPACGSGTTGCHGKCHDGRISRERQEQAIAETQARLFEQRGALWWGHVMREIARNLEA